MRDTCFLALTLSVLLLARTSTAGDAKPEEMSKDLLGTWTVVEGEINGKKLPGAAGTMRLIFTKDKVIWQFDTSDGEKAFDGTYKADPKKSPKEIDLSQPVNAKKVALGIYKIEGDRLTICMGAQRPKNFEDMVLSRLIFTRKKSK